MTKMNETNQTMEKSKIIDSVRQFIFNQFPTARHRSLGDADPLLESGIIDSLGVLDVVGFIESEFKITVADEDLTPENFQNIRRISEFVEKKILAAA
jgi:acyl carrier protein